MIYFIRCALTTRIKIGFSDEPWARLSQLQTASPTDLHLVALVEGDVAAEAAAHEQFAAYRVRGEWFSETGDLAAHVASLPPAVKPPRRRTQSGTALCAWMTANGVMNKDLAERLGVHPSFVSHLRAGIRQPLLPMAIKIVELTGVPYESLLAREAA